ncbi:hypothetical protein MMC25_001341 [Agyrium rufum]|nr:hypothetical protein [Agyrium rufum]
MATPSARVMCLTEDVFYPLCQHWGRRRVYQPCAAYSQMGRQSSGLGCHNASNIGARTATGLCENCVARNRLSHSSARISTASNLPNETDTRQTVAEEEGCRHQSLAKEAVQRIQRDEERNGAIEAAEVTRDARHRAEEEQKRREESNRRRFLREQEAAARAKAAEPTPAELLRQIRAANPSRRRTFRPSSRDISVPEPPVSLINIARGTPEVAKTSSDNKAIVRRTLNNELEADFDNNEEDTTEPLSASDAQVVLDNERTKMDNERAQMANEILVQSDTKGKITAYRPNFIQETVEESMWKEVEALEKKAARRAMNSLEKVVDSAKRVLGQESAVPSTPYRRKPKRALAKGLAILVENITGSPKSRRTVDALSPGSDGTTACGDRSPRSDTSAITAVAEPTTTRRRPATFDITVEQTVDGARTRLSLQTLAIMANQTSLRSPRTRLRPELSTTARTSQRPAAATRPEIPPPAPRASTRQSPSQTRNPGSQTRHTYYRPPPPPPSQSPCQAQRQRRTQPPTSPLSARSTVSTLTGLRNYRADLEQQLRAEEERARHQRMINDLRRIRDMEAYRREARYTEAVIDRNQTLAACRRSERRRRANGSVAGSDGSGARSREGTVTVTLAPPARGVTSVRRSRIDLGRTLDLQ